MSDEENDTVVSINGADGSAHSEDCAASAMCSSNNSRQDVDGQPSVTKMLKTWTFGRHKKGNTKVNGKKRKTPWTLRFGGQNHCPSGSEMPESAVGCAACICTRYRRTEEHHLGAGLVFNANPREVDEENESESVTGGASASAKLAEGTFSGIDLSKFSLDVLPVQNWVERQGGTSNARQESTRERDDPGECQPTYQNASGKAPNQIQLWDLTFFLQNGLSLDVMANPFLSRSEEVPNVALAHCALNNPCLYKSAPDNVNYLPTAHTRVDYEHCLVPDFLQITNSSYYWGKMDRYEADKLLENKPEGTFLLRDSAQEEYLFSVSFRRYGRTLHARVEQREHRFSFDSHDPNVFSSSTVCGLIEHYKYPSNCMFFEPKLTIRLHRVFPFSLQHLCRATVCSCVDYNSINKLHLPKILKNYLKEYHYKHKVRAENLDRDT